ncbi:MAG: DnaJ domain-containing protein [Planctomycetes bacterium]|nr:DnaJ domain-containing protein [Planctomycetota bacterium]
MASRRYWLLRFLIGLGLLLCGGLGLPGAVMTWWAGDGRYFLFDVAIGAFGFWSAIAAVQPLVHSYTVRSRLRADFGAELHGVFEQATLARRIFFLLLAIAEADGRAGAAERLLVRRFLLARYLDPVAADELVGWEAQGPPTRDLAALAAGVARNLDAAERDSLFHWCCLVAFADGRYGDAEHGALQAAARGLRLQPNHARSLFQIAKQQHMADQERRRQHGEQHRQQQAPPPDHAPLDDRQRALAVLDLPADASLPQIRRRHRELVKKFHPDAQPNLGQAAQQEAAERFRDIQRAYETLIS